MYYQEKGKTKQLIHELKYKNNQKIGYFLACWFGNELIKSRDFMVLTALFLASTQEKIQKKRV